MAPSATAAQACVKSTFKAIAPTALSHDTGRVVFGRWASDFCDHANFRAVSGIIDKN
jgi:hypothetical protein